MYPLPVLIIGTYDEEGQANAITFDPVHNAYLRLGEKVGNAFRDGAELG